MAQNLNLRDTVIFESSILNEEIENSEEETKRKQLIHDYVYNACHMWSKRHGERANDILDENITEHAWEVVGPAAMKTICQNTHSVFDEFQIIIQDIISEGTLDTRAKIACTFKAVGIWAREYCGLAPNGKKLEFPGLFRWTVVKGKITDSWIYQSYVEAPELGALLLQESHLRRNQD